MTSTKHLIVVLLVLLAGAAGAYLKESKVHVADGEATYAEVKTIAADNPTFDVLVKRFEDIADKKGAEYAFGVLRYAVIPPNTDIHLVAHAIGHKLYAQKGIDGMSICTQEFRNGCSHSIVVDTLQEFGDGDDVRAMIDTACKKAPGGKSAYGMCYHGLGHGVLAYYGYSLEKTISFCSKTGTAEWKYMQSQECIGGSIMELVGGGGHDRELWKKANATYFTASDPLAPCSTRLIPQSAKARCYVYITPHLLAAVGSDFRTKDTSKFADAMRACTALPFGSDRSSCIGGFGKDFVSVVGEKDIRKLDQGVFSDEQLRRVESLCHLVQAREDAYACESYALSYFFWGGDADPKLSLRFCSTLADDGSKDFCFNDLATSISIYIPDASVRAQRCGSLDKKYSDVCLGRRASLYTAAPLETH